jgi:hypothetical protein
MATFPAAETGILLRSAAHDRFARPGGIELAIGLATNQRRSSGGRDVIARDRCSSAAGWLDDRARCALLATDESQGAGRTILGGRIGRARTRS